MLDLTTDHVTITPDQEHILTGQEFLLIKIEIGQVIIVDLTITTADQGLITLITDVDRVLLQEQEVITPPVAEVIILLDHLAVEVTVTILEAVALEVEEAVIHQALQGVEVAALEAEAEDLAEVAEEVSIRITPFFYIIK